MATDEEKPETTNGAAPMWATLTIAARASGVSQRHLIRLADRGEIKRRRENEDGTGNWLYFVADAVALGVGREDVTPEVQLAKAQTDLLAKTTLHLERTWALVHGPMLDMMTELRTALKEANDDNCKLRAEMRKSDELRRSLESDEHTRRMAEELLKREQLRKDEALEGAKKAATAMWPDVRDALRSYSFLGRLKNTFDPTKIQALLDVPGMLSPEEAELLREMFNLKATAPDVVETSGAESEGSNVDG